MCTVCDALQVKCQFGLWQFCSLFVCRTLRTGQFWGFFRPCLPLFSIAYDNGSLAPDLHIVVSHTRV